MKDLLVMVKINDGDSKKNVKKMIKIRDQRTFNSDEFMAEANALIEEAANVVAGTAVAAKPIIRKLSYDDVRSRCTEAKGYADKQNWNMADWAAGRARDRIEQRYYESDVVDEANRIVDEVVRYIESAKDAADFRIRRNRPTTMLDIVAAVLR